MSKTDAELVALLLAETQAKQEWRAAAGTPANNFVGTPDERQKWDAWGFALVNLEVAALERLHE